MLFGCIINDNITQYKEWDSIESIPEHKRHIWRPVIDNPPEYDIQLQNRTGPVAVIIPDAILYEYSITDKSEKELVSLRSKIELSLIAGIYNGDRKLIRVVITKPESIAGHLQPGEFMAFAFDKDNALIGVDNENLTESERLSTNFIPHFKPIL